mmetsp:Transcript_108711/g.316298  ORF Transcript_108711/g.316298 Transcript_108711/m.316298 type:complete len:259 (-) Transcript_108711:235-1011(-)
MRQVLYRPNISTTPVHAVVLVELSLPQARRLNVRQLFRTKIGHQQCHLSSAVGAVERPRCPLRQRLPVRAQTEGTKRMATHGLAAVARRLHADRAEHRSAAHHTTVSIARIARIAARSVGVGSVSGVSARVTTGCHRGVRVRVGQLASVAVDRRVGGAAWHCGCFGEAKWGNGWMADVPVLPRYIIGVVRLDPRHPFLLPPKPALLLSPRFDRAHHAHQGQGHGRQAEEPDLRNRQTLQRLVRDVELFLFLFLLALRR